MVNHLRATDLSHTTWHRTRSSGKVALLDVYTL